MVWIYQIIAGLMEIGWPHGLKFSQTQSSNRFGWIVFAVVSMAASGGFLWLTRRTIPKGTGCAIRTGIIGLRLTTKQ